jgi:hypothetical protein
MIKGKNDADKGPTANDKIRLFVTPKKRTINPNNKIAAAADSSLGQTQPLDERGETIELEVIFLNNDHQGPMASCGSGGNMLVINCSEDNVESILLRVDSILQDIMQNINDVANFMFLGIDGVSHVFENSLEVAAYLELARRERVKKI